MLTKIKLLLDLKTDEKDGLITLLINQACEEARQFTHNDNIDGLSQAIIGMVIYNYNRLGTEGLNSEGYAGVSYNYTADYPEAILRQLKAKRKVMVI